MHFQSIAFPSAYASFFELDLRGYSPTRDGSDATIAQLRHDLAAQRLLLVHDETALDARQWARRLARDLSAEAELPVLEWQGFTDEASDALDLNALFAADEGGSAITEPAIFIIPDAKQTGLVDWFFSLQPVLERRNQYAILATALPQACWQLTPKDADTFWRTPGSMETSASTDACSSHSSTRVNVAGIYRHLNRSEQLCLVGLCLFGELRDDHFFAAMARLMDEAWPGLRYSVGLFDYADLARIEPMLRYVEVQPGYSKIEHRTAGQRRQLLGLIRRSRWHHLRVALPVLGSLLEEWLAEENEQSSEYAYVARATTGALGDLARCSAGSVADLLWQLATSKSPAVRAVAARVLAGDDPHDDEQRDLYRLLETWVNQRLSDGGADEVADEIDDEAEAKAAWDSPAQRARQTALHAVALAVAASARCPHSPALPAPLERARVLLQGTGVQGVDVEDMDGQGADEDQAPAESASFAEPEPQPEPEPFPGVTIIPEPSPTPEPTPTSQAQADLLEIARNPDQHDTVVEVISNAGTAEIIIEILRTWQARAGYERESDWLPVAFVAAHTNFRRTLGADGLYGWLAQELTDATPAAYATVATLLPHNRYAYHLVLPDHLLQLSDLLLHLAQNPALRLDLVQLFTTVYARDPQAVQETLETWYTYWQHRHEDGSAWNQIDWDAVQSTVWEICQRIGCQGWTVWADHPAEPAPGEEPPAGESGEPDEPEIEFVDLADMVRYAGRGDAERRQVIARFISAYRSDPAATQKRLNDLQMQALQRLNEDVNSSVEGLGLIGIIRDRIEEIEDHDAP